MSRAALTPAVFLDRDGTLMEDVPYIQRAEDVRVFSGVPQALARLKAAGFRNVIVTNQSGIGRGWQTLEQFEAVQARLLAEVGAELIDAVYFCAARPDENSPRRKPAPGMILEAARDLCLDLARSWMVGDKSDDVECGRTAGVRTVQVCTGNGAAQRRDDADFFAEDFASAVEFILSAPAH